MLKEKEDAIRKALILSDAFAVSIAFFLSYFLRQHFHVFYKLYLIPFTEVVSSNSTSISEYLVLLFFVVPVWCFMLYLNGIYRSMRTRKLFEISWIIIKSAFFTSLALGTLIFIFKLQFVSRLFFAIFVMVGLTFLLAERIAIFSIMQYARKEGHSYRRLLVVGTGRRAASLIDKINNHPEWGFKIAGAINDEPSRKVEKVKETEVIGTVEDLYEILHMNAIDQVMFIVPRSRLNHIENAVHACETQGVKATIAVDLFDLKIARSNPTELDGIPLITLETTVAKEGGLFIKRGIDIIISGLGIILLSPILFIVAISIKLSSSGPVLFKQERLGLNGRKFILYKFRTMYEGAQELLSRGEDVKEMDKPDFRKKKIQWITPIGRVLRKFSLDELPQLFNVFAGHMSLVGPRPTPADEVVQYQPWQRRRLSMRPGITCQWQINGRNKIGFEEWMKLDLEYLDNWSLWLDFKILVSTIPVVLFGTGAY